MENSALLVLIDIMRPARTAKELLLIKWERGAGTLSQNSVDIFGDIECFGCGCQSLVNLQTGDAMIQYLCERHRQLSYSILRQLR